MLSEPDGPVVRVGLPTKIPGVLKIPYTRYFFNNVPRETIFEYTTKRAFIFGHELGRLLDTNRTHGP
jgi:hypothetical protein